MLKSKTLFIGGLTLFLGAVFFLCPIFVSQAEDAKEAKEVQEAKEVVEVPTVYWIGVQIVPVPEIFLSHFGEGGESKGLIAVDRVVPDSPAAKADVKRGDVIRKFGGREIHTLPDLVEAVSKAKEAATELQVIRDGAKKTLSVAPVPRPEDFRNIPGLLNLREMQQMPLQGHRLPPHAFPGRDPQQVMRQMEEFFRQLQGGDDGDDLILVPNVPQQKVDTGKQLSVVTQTQDGKTTIKVTQTLKDGDKTEKKTWEVENADELPEEIRPDVKMLLGR